jgi:hypothetical protein
VGDCSTKVMEGLVAMVSDLVQEAMRGSEPESIGEMEARVTTALRQAGEVWLGKWLTILGTAPMPPEIPCPCGEKAFYNRMREGVLPTMLGRISFRRRYYLCPHCHQGQYPLDDALGFEAGQMTPKLVSIAGRVGAELPFRRGSELLEALCGISLSENSLREATQRMGREMSTQEAEWEAESEEVAALKARDRVPKEKKPERLYGSLDGVLVPIGAEWRELKIGSWYREGPRKGDKTPRAVDITYYADITSAEGFGRLFWATGYQRWADQAVELIFVADGAVWIWNLVTDYFPKAVQIVDWYHAVEYIAPIANALFGENTAKSRAWQERVKSDLWEGRFDQVLQAFQSQIDHPQAGPAAQRAFTYYTNNRERMRYPYFRAQGYRIGSGTAESACKQIGTQRLKVAGARWSEEGARDTAKARAALLSGQWDQISARFGAIPLCA